MIQIACPNCGKKYQVRDENAGKRTKCPACQTMIDIPDANAEGNVLADVLQNLQGATPGNVPVAAALQPPGMVMASGTVGPMSGMAITSFVLGLLGVLTGCILIAVRSWASSA